MVDHKSVRDAIGKGLAAKYPVGDAMPDEMVNKLTKLAKSMKV